MPITAPVISSNGGGATATINLKEGITAVTTVAASDAEGNTLTYKIVGGSDRLKFKIDAATGVLTFASAPDFETAADYGKNNVYDVIVEVSDGTMTDTQTIAVKIGNVDPVTKSGTSGDDTLGSSGMTVDGDVLSGLGGNDTLDGGLGADVMNGGAGNDTFIVDNIGDVCNEDLNAGTDQVKSSVTYSLGANIESLILTGAAVINGTGNALANTLTGNTAANILNGGGEADTMVGGAGNDVYVVDIAGDIVTELDGEGTDRVESGVAYTLGSYLENLTLTGTAAIAGTGNSLNNIIIGNTAANTLSGLDGNDTLNGGGGADSMAGGIGNDTYVVDNASDTITEALNAGTDLVQASVTYSIASIDNVENLTLTGTSAINGTGNALNNILIGNSGANKLTGNDGDDTLTGGTNADTMIGGNGNDKYSVDNAGDVVTELSNQGTDTVTSTISFSIAALGNVENITLGGSAASATGNSLNNELIGNTAANTLSGGAGNDVLNGMGGIDIMAGGTGDDTYYVGNAGETITEAASEGTDLVYSTLTWALASNVENLVLTGSAAINATGNILNNALTGNIGVNSLTGLDGNDTLDGGRGNDIMVGGAGNDTYYVGETGDTVTEAASGGTDTVVTALSGYTLVNEVENLTLGGTASIAGNGNSLNNTITGNTGWNTLNGAAGNDTILGGAGADTITGGSGVDIMTGGTEYDTFVFTSLTDSGLVAGSRDSITDFTSGEKINLSAIDAKSTESLDQSFTFGTGADSSYGAGELQVSVSGSVATVSLYVDNNSTADMTFTVTLAAGTTTLLATDFIL